MRGVLDAILVLGFSFPSFIQSLHFSLKSRNVSSRWLVFCTFRGQKISARHAWALLFGPKPNEDIRQTSSSSSSSIAVLAYKLGSRQIDATAYL